MGIYMGIYICILLCVLLLYVLLWVYLMGVYLNILTLFFYKCVCSRQTQEPVTVLSFMEGG